MQQFMVLSTIRSYVCTYIHPYVYALMNTSTDSETNAAYT